MPSRSVQIKYWDEWWEMVLCALTYLLLSGCFWTFLLIQQPFSAVSFCCWFPVLSYQIFPFPFSLGGLCLSDCYLITLLEWLESDYFVMLFLSIINWKPIWSRVVLWHLHKYWPLLLLNKNRKIRAKRFMIYVKGKDLIWGRVFLLSCEKDETLLEKILSQTEESQKRDVTAQCLSEIRVRKKEWSRCLFTWQIYAEKRISTFTAW